MQPRHPAGSRTPRAAAATGFSVSSCTARTRCGCPQKAGQQQDRPAGGPFRIRAKRGNKETPRTMTRQLLLHRSIVLGSIQKPTRRSADRPHRRAPSRHGACRRAARPAHALLGQPVDPRGRRAPAKARRDPRLAGRTRPAVDRCPHDLGADVLRDPGRGNQAVAAGTRPAWISRPSPSGRVPQTKHSSNSGAPHPPTAGPAASTASSKVRRRDRRIAGACLGDERVAVAQEHAVAVPGHGERPLEGGGSRSVTSTADGPTARAEPRGRRTRSPT